MTSVTKKAPAKKASPQDKIVRLVGELDTALVDRREEIVLTYTAMVGQTTYLMIGPPGSAKSFALEAAVKGGIEGANYFYWMVGKFTEPREIFGPVDITALKAGKNKCVTRGKLPEAHFAFLDEIWKCSTAIGNTLLRIVNERVFDNGEGEQKVPLRCLVVASNEYPQDATELGAMFDRFVVRKNVRYVEGKTDRLRLLQLKGEAPRLSEKLTLAELDRAYTESQALPVPPEVWDTLSVIVEELIKEGVRPSDRRLPLAMRVTKAYAYVLGASQIEVEHLEVLKHVLWNDPEEGPAKCERVVNKYANPIAVRVADLRSQAEDVVTKAEGNTDLRSKESVATHAADKCQEILNQLDHLKDRAEVLRAREHVADCLRRSRLLILGVKE